MLLVWSIPAIGARPVVRWHATTLAIGITTAWVTFAWALIAQHRALQSHAYDLAYFDQVIWNTSHGRWFETTFVEFTFLGEHVSPILLLFAALYRVGGTIETVLLVQAGVVALAAWPLAVAAGRLLGSPTAGLLVAGAYLLAAPLHGAVLFDFHPELLGIAIVFAAFALLVHRRPTAALSTVAALVLMKEDAALVGLSLAWLFWLRGYRRHALLLTAGAALYGLLVMGLLMPHLRGDAPGLMARYGYLGDGPFGIIQGVLHHPDRVWDQVSSAGPRDGIATLLFTTALLPLGSPAVLALLPVVGPNLLSTHPPQGSLDGHYATYPVALVLIAALLGAEQLLRSRRRAWIWTVLRVPAHRRPVLLGMLLLAASTISWAGWSPLGGRFEPDTYRVTPHAVTAARVMAMIPPDAAVSAQSNLLPHLSRRTWVRDFPRLDGVEYVVVDFQTWGMWQTTFEIYAAVYESLPSLGFCPIHEEDGLHLYQHQGSCASPTPAEGDQLGRDAPGTSPVP